MNLKLMLTTAVLMASPLTQAHTVYVESNRGDANSLLAFDLADTGALTAKVEIPTGGKGVVDPTLALGPFDSDQQVIMSRDRNTLFAVNAGSNTIAVFKVAKDGSLQPVAGSPFDSHGVNPVSVGLKGDILTVVNKHQDPAQAMDASLPNYTTFKVSYDGSLHWTGNAYPVAPGSSPSQALISPFESIVFGADFMGGILRSFVIDHRGVLHGSSALALPASAFPNTTTPRFPLGLAAHPKTNVIYVGLPTANKIGVYAYNVWGKMKLANVIDDSGAVVCWLTTNREGTRLYASNTADPSVTVYDIGTAPETPRELQKLTLPSKGGAYQLSLTPDEKQLVVLTQRFQASTPQGQGNEIHILKLDAASGMLTQPTAPLVLNLPTDTRPQGVLVY